MQWIGICYFEKTKYLNWCRFKDILSKKRIPLHLLDAKSRIEYLNSKFTENKLYQTWFLENIIRIIINFTLLSYILKVWIYYNRIVIILNAGFRLYLPGKINSYKYTWSIYCARSIRSFVWRMRSLQEQIANTNPSSKEFLVYYGCYSQITKPFLQISKAMFND